MTVESTTQALCDLALRFGEGDEESMVSLFSCLLDPLNMNFLLSNSSVVFITISFYNMYAVRRYIGFMPHWKQSYHRLSNTIEI